MGLLFFVEPLGKVSAHYYWDILLSQQISTATKHAVDENSAFQKDSAPGRGARNTVQLRSAKLSTSFLPRHGVQQPQTVGAVGRLRLITRFRSHSVW